MTPTFFAKPSDFRKWLKKNHQKEMELLVGFYKTGSGIPSITWPEAVDEALCFGWIDGVRKSIDKDSYQIRFSQRKVASIWSAVNIKKVAELIKDGRMEAAGRAIFEQRKADKSNLYSYEREEASFTPGFEKQFKSNKKAWQYFQSLSPSYKKVSTHWVMSAKQETTQISRLDELIKDSETGTNRWKDNKYKKKW